MGRPSTRFGTPSTRTSQSSCFAHGNNFLADVILKHDNGIQTNIHLDYYTKPEQRSFFIVGDQGTICADIPGRQIIFNDSNGGIVYDCPGSFEADYLTEMHEFMRRINSIPGPGATGEDGLATLQLILDAKKLAGLS